MGKILSRPLGIEQSDGDPIPTFDFITLANMRDGIAKPVQVVGIDITENGEYEAPPGYAYSPANVNVSGGTPTLITKTITENGTYSAEDDDADGYSEVTVNVQGGGGGTTLQSTVDRTISGDINIASFNASYGDGGTNVWNALFQYCDGITSLVFSNIGYVPTALVFMCKGIKSISMPDAVAGSHNVCKGCTALEEAYFPKLSLSYWGYSQQGNSFFEDCNNLTNVFMPLFSLIQSSMFKNCYKLPAYENDVCTKIVQNAFDNCRKLKTLILRNTEMVILSNVNAFTSTPFRGYGGTYSGHIYVPQALISSYESASNWSTLVASYPGLFTAIEGSSYENARLDGTPLT